MVEEIGLAFLGVTSAFGLHSAINPSLFTIKAFGVQDPKAIQTGLSIGLLAVLGLAAGIRMTYGKEATIPAIATGLTGVGLYLLSQKALKDARLDTSRVDY